MEKVGYPDHITKLANSSSIQQTERIQFLNTGQFNLLPSTHHQRHWCVGSAVCIQSYCRPRHKRSLETGSSSSTSLLGTSDTWKRQERRAQQMQRTDHTNIHPVKVPQPRKQRPNEPWLTPNGGNKLISHSQYRYSHTISAYRLGRMSQRYKCQLIFSDGPWPSFSKVVDVQT